MYHSKGESLHLNISGVTLVGTNLGDFPQTNTCGATLATNANCTISVTFKPTATGARSAQVSIAGDASGSPHLVTLTGTGTDFTLDVASGSSTSATVNAGQTATYNLNISPGGFVGAVGLACAWAGSQPRGTSSLVAPASVNPDGTNAATVTISVATTARSQSPPSSLLRHGPTRFHGKLLVWLLLLLLMAQVRASLLAGFRTRYGLGVAVLAVVLCASCSGGGGGGSPPPAPQTGTPAGTYTLTVTATANGVSKPPVNLTLKVN